MGVSTGTSEDRSGTSLQDRRHPRGRHRHAGGHASVGKVPGVRITDVRGRGRREDEPKECDGVIHSSYGCSTVVLICFTCPTITVGTVMLRALDIDRVRERALGCFTRSPKSPPARRHVMSPTCHRVP